jgi:hypothetical protein
LFSSARLYKALKEAEYPDLPSERTVRDWIKNDSAPKGARIYAAKALGIEKETPAEAGAAEELLRRWLGNEPPPWAQGLTDQIVSAIEGDRQAVVSAAIEAAVDVAERRLFEGSDPEAETPPTDPPPETEEGRPRPEA